MDCGIPFCHDGCPLGNLIPDWNDHMFRGASPRAIASLDATNNFPEFTGRVCPAPCEAGCVLNIEGKPVTHQERRARHRGSRVLTGTWWRRSSRSSARARRSRWSALGPAGLAAAQQLARKGHDVTLFERDDRIGGLLRYGIPDFKMEKHLIDRRMEQMQAEG